MFRIVAAARTNDGGRPTVFAAEELHEWTGNRARVVISNSIAKWRDGIVLVISTAGSEDSELLRGPYDYGRWVAPREIEDPAFCSTGPRPDRCSIRTTARGPGRDGAPGQSVHRVPLARIPYYEWRRSFAYQWVARPAGVLAAARCVGAVTG